MPRLTASPPIPTTNIQFIVSLSLDMMNAMYFTSLVPQIEGVEGWPLRLRAEMSPELLRELDAIYNYPAGDPGILGTFGDDLFAHPETWRDISALLRYVREMTDGEVHELIYQTTFRYVDEAEREPYEGLPPREAIERRMRSFDDRDADEIMAAYDRPEDLRERMARLIERFYEEHYREEMPRRLPRLERSAAAHRGEPVTDPVQITRAVTGRDPSCLENVCAGPFQRYIFTPSLDMGPYNSCAVVDGIHGVIYPCEQQYVSETPQEEETVRLARVHKALGDEQRLRILSLLQEREMYAQEIVERTGIHQSVVSRHLAFMKAVGLVQARRQNNMKFFSLNPGIREQLGKTMEMFSK